MSGRIGFVSHGDGAILSELLGRDRWRVTVGGVDNPGMARSLAAYYEGTYAGPQGGYYGQSILRDLAARMGGVAVYEPPPPAGFGDIP